MIVFLTNLFSFHKIQSPMILQMTTWAWTKVIQPATDPPKQKSLSKKPTEVEAINEKGLTNPSQMFETRIDQDSFVVIIVLLLIILYLFCPVIQIS